MSGSEHPGVGIRPLAAGDVDGASKLWNACCDEPDGPLYRRFGPHEFDALFREPADDLVKVSLAAADGECVVGFANGTVRPGTDRAYVTAVMVAREYRRRGVGSRLLAELERALAAAPGAGAVDRYEVTFFNP
ncbi:MAG: N-acetyltransferase family protein, partial [Spirochaetota bacterium]